MADQNTQLAQPLVNQDSANASVIPAIQSPTPSAAPTYNLGPMPSMGPDSKYIVTDAPEQLRQAQMEQARIESDIDRHKAETQRQYMQPIIDKEQQATQEYRKKHDEITKQLEQKYQIPQPTAQDYFAQGTMIAIMGTLLGRQGGQSATAAINAMAGYQKGVKEGNQQLVENSIKEYNNNMARLKAQADALTNDYNAILKSLQTDRDRAALLINEANAKYYDSVSQNYAKNKGANAYIEMMQNVKNAKFQLDKSRLDTWLKAYEIQSKAANRGVGGGLNGRYAFNINEAAQQAGQDLINIAKQPKGSVLGTFADMTGMGGDSIIKALRNTFTRTATEQDNRAFQQLVSGFEFNMSRALGGGYAQSSAKAAVDAYKQQVARSGDSPYAMAIFLARAKQELTLLNYAYKSHPGANDAEKQQMQNMINQVNSYIPFNIDQIQEAMGKGRETVAQSSQNLVLPKAPTLQEFLTEAKKHNPNVPEQELINYYNTNYGVQ